MRDLVAAMIIPTGIGCAIGGHAGDATPAARLLASVADTLIIHPNVVNASDINEMTDNMLYVEGSTLDAFLNSVIRLEPVRKNKILLAVNDDYTPEVVNAVSAARATLGAEIEIEVLREPLVMKSAFLEDGSASGIVEGADALVDQVRGMDFDALAISTKIEVSDEVKADYLKNGGVNPWGGVEAKASKIVSSRLNKPVAHAPFLSYDIEENLIERVGVVDPRMSAEFVSVCYLHCVLKGLHRAPRITPHPLSLPAGWPSGCISATDVDCLISPMCWGRPHDYCRKHGVLIILVEENTTIYKGVFPKDGVTFVHNYIEAAGLLSLIKAGLTVESVRRPIGPTKVNQV